MRVLLLIRSRKCPSWRESESIRPGFCLTRGQRAWDRTVYVTGNSSCTLAGLGRRRSGVTWQWQSVFRKGREASLLGKGMPLLHSPARKQKGRHSILRHRSLKTFKSDKDRSVFSQGLQSEDKGGGKESFSLSLAPSRKLFLPVHWTLEAIGRKQG